MFDWHYIISRETLHFVSSGKGRGEKRPVIKLNQFELKNFGMLELAVHCIKFRVIEFPVHSSW